MRKIIPSNAVLVPKNAQKVFTGIIFDVYHWTQEMYDGSATTFEMLKRPDTVEILAIVKDKVIVLNEEQPHAGQRINLPAGRVDPTDSDVLSAAKRELHEETGYSMKQWKLLLVKQPHFKVEWFIYTFVAWEALSEDEPHIDVGEKITVSLEPFEKVKQMSLKGTGYLGEVQDILKPVNSLQELLTLPAFNGQTVDR
jgi:ADP-ribose pyrophosphatase